ncbi:hypothetical protein EYF80_001074 [Liparis tanakae]|uniref:Uncharacterized protein n=1 Tax=Liparis tanakae TaxID=230148 RepID=A0A4Z2JHK5_9TELE|nr:hypothetical protein EYF80_001074 [Liparis tanakae]
MIGKEISMQAADWALRKGGRPGPLRVSRGPSGPIGMRGLGWESSYLLIPLPHPPHTNTESPSLYEGPTYSDRIRRDGHASGDLQAIGRVDVQAGDLLWSFSICPQQLDDQLCLVARRDPDHPACCCRGWLGAAGGVERLAPKDVRSRTQCKDTMSSIRTGGAMATKHRLKRFTEQKCSPSNHQKKKKHIWVYECFRVFVFNVWLSSHIWLFRLESSQLIAARFLDQRQRVSFRPGPVFSTNHHYDPKPSLAPTASPRKRNSVFAVQGIQCPLGARSADKTGTYWFKQEIEKRGAIATIAMSGPNTWTAQWLNATDPGDEIMPLSVHLLPKRINDKSKGGRELMKVKGYIRMPPVLEPMARIFCTGSKANAVGWGNKNSCEHNIDITVSTSPYSLCINLLPPPLPQAH